MFVFLHTQTLSPKSIKWPRPSRNQARRPRTSLRPLPTWCDTPRILHLDHLPDLRSALDRHMECDLRPCIIRTRFIADTPVTPLRLATDEFHESITVLVHHDVDDPVSQEYRSSAFLTHLPHPSNPRSHPDPSNMIRGY